MPAMTEEDIAPYASALLFDTLRLRKDMHLIADIETRRGGKFNMTVHAIPKTEETDELVYRMKSDEHAFRWGDHNHTVRAYMGVMNGQPTLRASREKWHYATWKNEKTHNDEKGWLLLDRYFENESTMMGAMALPIEIGHMIEMKSAERKDCLHIADPYRNDIVTMTALYYRELQPPYAVEDFSAHVYPDGYINDIRFTGNHPTLNISAAVYASSHPGYRLERKPNGDPESLPDTVNADEAWPIWEKIRQHDRNYAQVCTVFGVPDVTQFNQKPAVMPDINAFDFDGVTGNYCPALDATYKRLGMKLRP